MKKGLKILFVIIVAIFCFCVGAYIYVNTKNTEANAGQEDKGSEEAASYVSQAMDEYPLLKAETITNGSGCDAVVAIFDNQESQNYGDTAKGIEEGITLTVTLEREETSEKTTEKELLMLANMQKALLEQDTDTYNSVSIDDAVMKDIKGDCYCTITYNICKDGKNYPSKTVIQVYPMSGGHYKTVQIDIDGSVHQQEELLLELADYYDIEKDVLT